MFLFFKHLPQLWLVWTLLAIILVSFKTLKWVYFEFEGFIFVLNRYHCSLKSSQYFFLDLDYFFPLSNHMSIFFHLEYPLTKDCIYLYHSTLHYMKNSKSFIFRFTQSLSEQTHSTSFIYASFLKYTKHLVFLLGKLFMSQLNYEIENYI